MRFEKWQALGNDYLIVERDALPFPLTAERVRRLCDRHTGPGGDGVLELAPPDEPGFVARLRIFNPDGSEAELSGNGAREAILYLRRAGWTDQRQFSIQTVGGRDPADDPRPDHVPRRHGPRDAALAPTTPAGDADGTGEVRGRRFQHVAIGNPQCAIRDRRRRASSRRSTSPSIGPADRARPALPEPHERVVLVRRPARRTIRARIFERGVGETQSSGTGACGAAVAFALRGGDSPVTVQLDGGELEVDVDESLHVDLTGWAVPVYRGARSAPSCSTSSR